MIGKLEAQEEEMTEQLKRLEELTGHHLSHVQKEHELGKQSWRMPFLILIISICKTFKYFFSLLVKKYRSSIFFASSHRIGAKKRKIYYQTSKANPHFTAKSGK